MLRNRNTYDNTCYQKIGQPNNKLDLLDSWRISMNYKMIINILVILHLSAENEAQDI
jgi:hypothetical protein